MLFCVRELYDPAIYISRDEAKQLYRQDIDIQATIETPHFYMLGQSRSTVEDQMRFVPTRQEDLKQFEEVLYTESGVHIKDKMRYMNGDNPAAQMEDGSQHGGNYPCVGFDGNIHSSYDLHIAKKIQISSTADFVLAGPAERKTTLHPFKDLQKTALLCADVHVGKALKEDDLNLSSYEVVCFEALHTTMNHIKNVLTELPHHISNIDSLITLKEILSIQLRKEKLRGVDYRKPLIIVAIAMYQVSSVDVRALLITSDNSM